MPRDVWLDDDGKQLLVPAKLGRLLKIKGHRLLVGTPVTAHLVLRADGHWYALIGCETTPQDAACGEAHPTQADCEHAAIGLDAGLKVFLADAEGAVVENPRHYRRGQQCLAKAQHVSDRRRTKGSHRRRTKGSHRRRTKGVTAVRRNTRALYSIARSPANGVSSTSRPRNRMRSAMGASASKI